MLNINDDAGGARALASAKNPRRVPRDVRCAASFAGRQLTYWVLSWAVSVFLLAATASAQLRVVTYNVAHLLGDKDAIEAVFAAIHQDDKPGFAVPISVLVCQEVRNADLVPLLNALNNSAPPGITYAVGTYTNNSEDGSGGAQAMFYRTDKLIELAGGHDDIFTGAGRYADRWQLRLLAYDSPDARFYIYSAHLKSDTGSANQNQRLTGVMNIRSNADALGPNQHIIYCGDFNFYNNTEPGYGHFFTAGNGQAVDPLGTGSWAGSDNAIKHTQSPRLASGPMAGGGMDDRFDFQLVSNAFDDGQGLSLMTGAPFVYRAFGNDGMHYDQAINSGNNFYYPGQAARSNALADALHDASDHVPVIVDYQLPAVLIATIEPSFGRVIQGADFQVPIEIRNGADVVVPHGADQLVYVATGFGAFSGQHNGSVAALGDADTPAFTLNTSSVGPTVGVVQVISTSQGVQNPSVQLAAGGRVVRPACASFDANDVVTEKSIALNADSGDGTLQIPVNIYNLGFDENQALLDIDAIARLTAPFSIVSRGLPADIGADPATLTFAFDAAGLPPGDYSAAITIEVSDEDVPGETAAALNLTLAVTVSSQQPTCNSDIDNDGLVNVDDLLAVISAWGACADPSDCPADIAPLGGDGVVNVDDLLAVISAWGACE